MKRIFRLNINGAVREVKSKSDRLLLDILREDLGLTGTKRGCGIGACGACTVLLDGKPNRACRIKIEDIALKSECQTQATDHRSQAIITIEGLSQGDRLHPIQQAFIDCGAIQCGFCTPGMVLTAKALLDQKPDPTRNAIKTALRGNLCRCTGYQQIFEAVEEAAKKIRGS